MGSGTSKPLPDLPTNNYFCITFTSFDRLTVLYGGKYSQFEFFIFLSICDMLCEIGIQGFQNLNIFIKNGL